ncbi:MAG TPA: hypothetical protein VEU94_02440 [Terriglobales bacterium]|nr:hypothetical protein [Terriglobales bacterium]
MNPRFSRSLVLTSAVLFAAAFSFAQNSRQLPADHLLKHAHPRYLKPAPRGHVAPGLAHGIPGIDSLTNWNGSYHAIGFDHSGNLRKTWYYNMVGNKPERGGTTTIHAPVVPVSLDLLNPDGSVFLHYDPQPFILPALQSPLFQNSTFTSSPIPTQITDAVQRAEFFNTMAPDWHTMLYASLKQERTMKVPADSYFYSLKNNGKCCRFVLIDINAFFNLLFPADPADTVTPIGAAENAGDITTQDISTFLFPNTYLYFGTPDQCCVLGFHTYDFEPGDDANGNKEKRYVVNYSAYISPGLFGSAFTDVTALSHEIAEIFNDPFVVSDGKHNLTPWWLAPNGNCQDDLEVGDVIEGLPRATFPVKMNGRTYHPQNEALLQWFEFESPSSAIHGAYSYPDETTLTALSPIELPGCQ